MFQTLPLSYLKQLAEQALQEDAPWGDITSATLFDPDLESRFCFRFKKPGVVCGLPLVEVVIRCVQQNARWTTHVTDGTRVEADQIVAVVEGKAVSLLHAERVALNFLQRLSGIATLTYAFVEKAKLGNAQTRVLDTRKTTPGLRIIEKYAVRVGGGYNHRMGLSDGIMLKDNHWEIMNQHGISLNIAFETLRRCAIPGMPIQVEVESLQQLETVLSAGADWVLLDNMPLPMLSDAVALAKGKALTEASGGITLDNVQQVAACGVDLISVGALTHSVAAIDIALDYYR